MTKEPLMTSKFLWMVVCAVALVAAMGTFFGRSVAKKPDDAQLRKKLTEEQYNVTQQCGTEPPFKNAYWNNHEDGVYVDVVSGRAAVLLFGQVRLWHRLAELHPAPGGQRLGLQERRRAWHVPHGGALRRFRLSSGPRLR